MSPLDTKDSKETPKPQKSQTPQKSVNKPIAGRPVQKYITKEHTIGTDEALSTIALHYYGHATPPYYNLIFEANRAVIGDTANDTRPGMVIMIPELPDNMKD